MYHSFCKFITQSRGSGGERSEPQLPMHRPSIYRKNGTLTNKKPRKGKTDAVWQSGPALNQIKAIYNKAVAGEGGVKCVTVIVEVK